MVKWRKSIGIGIVAVVLSTVGIQASDMLRNIDGNLSGLLIESGGPCEKGSVQLLLGVRTICVDEYEASPSVACDIGSIVSPEDTQTNLNNKNCQSVSVSDVQPWKFVSFTQAQQLCARGGKRLPTNEEWYRAASGMGDMSSCVINPKNAASEQTGTELCVSPLGIYDMIGNVWEWVDEGITNGEINGRNLPNTGYVSSVDREGIVLETSGKPSEEFGADYAWTSSDGVKAMIRGGYFASGEDAGIFAQNMSVSLNLKTAGVGFRCVQDL